LDVFNLAQLSTDPPIDPDVDDCDDPVVVVKELILDVVRGSGEPCPVVATLFDLVVADTVVVLVVTGVEVFVVTGVAALVVITLVVEGAFVVMEEALVVTTDGD